MENRDVGLGCGRERRAGVIHILFRPGIGAIQRVCMRRHEKKLFGVKCRLVIVPGNRMGRKVPFLTCNSCELTRIGSSICILLINYTGRGSVSSTRHGAVESVGGGCTLSMRCKSS